MQEQGHRTGNVKTTAPATDAELSGAPNPKFRRDPQYSEPRSRINATRCSLVPSPSIVRCWSEVQLMTPTTAHAYGRRPPNRNMINKTESEARSSTPAPPSPVTRDKCEPWPTSKKHIVATAEGDVAPSRSLGSSSCCRRRGPTVESPLKNS